MENGEREGEEKKVKELGQKEKQRDGELYAERDSGAAQSESECGRKVGET